MLDFVRSAQNPWSQEVLMGVAWDLMWAAIAVGALFAIGHAIWKATVAPSEKDLYESGTAPVGPNEKVKKYTGTARVFHWLMAAAMLVLLVTAFVPVMGLQFPWVTIHWIAGVALIGLIVFHIFHSTIFLDFWSMWVDGGEERDPIPGSSVAIRLPSSGRASTPGPTSSSTTERPSSDSASW